MSIRVLVVDDSRFFRVRVSEILNADGRLEVVGVAENGLQAIEKSKTLSPDVITMDIEMPVMDGITAVKRIMSRSPIPILIFSSLTTDGAKVTLDALDAGAVDYLPKRMEDLSKNHDEARRHFCNRVWQIGVQGKRKLRSSTSSGTPACSRPSSTLSNKSRTKTFSSPRNALAADKQGPVADLRRPVKPGSLAKYRVLAIGSSTGGPVALQDILTTLPLSFPLPILITQHMPGTFTGAFSERLNNLCDIKVKEAEDGDVLMPGVAFLAPGGKQMTVDIRGGHGALRVYEAEEGQTYKPSVDVTYTSLAKAYPGEVLAVVLTGMGADGREGAKLLKNDGSTVWAQNESSCVVFGMPGAVVEAGIVDQILPLSEIGPQLVAGI